jgi:hypothetical protein
MTEAIVDVLLLTVNPIGDRSIWSVIGTQLFGASKSTCIIELMICGGRPVSSN